MEIYHAYKCPTCDFFIRAIPSRIVGDATATIKRVLRETKGKPMVVPTDKWRENEKIKQNLESLGYW